MIENTAAPRAGFQNGNMSLPSAETADVWEAQVRLRRSQKEKRHAMDNRLPVDREKEWSDNDIAPLGNSLLRCFFTDRTDGQPLDCLPTKYIEVLR